MTTPDLIIEQVVPEATISQGFIQNNLLCFANYNSGFFRDYTDFSPGR